MKIRIGDVLVRKAWIIEGTDIGFNSKHEAELFASEAQVKEVTLYNSNKDPKKIKDRETAEGILEKMGAKELKLVQEYFKNKYS